MQESQSEFQYASQSLRLDHRNISERTQDFNHYLGLIKNALRQYEDIDDDDFAIIEQNIQSSINNSSTGQYLHNHRTLVPIGSNYQAILPPMLTEAAYKAKTYSMMQNLQRLKVNDPVEGDIFYQQNWRLIEERLGSGRTYEEIIFLRSCYNKLTSKLSFEEYLVKNLKYWESYFKNKSRSMASRQPIKKKKKKGTIPI